MNKKLLSKMLRGDVAIPYSESMVDAIDQACRSYENGDIYVLMDEMLECFLIGKVSQSFKKHMEKILEMDSIPTNVVQRIAQYRCYTMVMEEEDELKKSILATIFMNYILAVRGCFNKLTHAEIMIQLYDYHISNYIEKNDKIETDGEISIIEMIASADSVVEILTDEENVDKQLKSIAKQASLYRYKRIIEETEIKSIGDPFLRVYKGLSDLIGNMDYLFYNVDVIDMINSLLTTEEQSKRKKLDSIISKISEKVNEELEYYTSSSIMIRLIDGDKSLFMKGLRNQSFSIKEFAIYLYFELLLERIIQKESE